MIAKQSWTLSESNEVNKFYLYKIICKDENIKNFYLGLSTNLKRKEYQHKYECITPTSNAYNKYVYKFIRDNGGWSNWIIKKFRRYKNIDKNKAKSKERKYYDLLKPSLNLNKPHRTKKEYYQDNKNKILEKQKIYNQKYKTKKYNKEKISIDKVEYPYLYEYSKQRIECECGHMVSRIRLDVHKKSRLHMRKMNNKKLQEEDYND